jgi:hypothetical protein
MHIGIIKLKEKKNICSAQLSLIKCTWVASPGMQQFPSQYREGKEKE